MRKEGQFWNKFKKQLLMIFMWEFGEREGSRITFRFGAGAEGEASKQTDKKLMCCEMEVVGQVVF